MSNGGILSSGFLVLGKALIIGTLVTVLVGCTPSGSTPIPMGMVSDKPCHARHINEADPQAWLPDPRCTPGVINPAVTLGQLCPHVAEYLRRPPTSYTDQIKLEQLAQYDYVDSFGSHTFTPQDTEGDHLISRELGGALSAPKNLWPEPHASFNEKDKVEGAAHAAICAGRLTLPQAQQGIAANWIELGKRLGVKY